jgi:hypothetical protein
MFRSTLKIAKNQEIRKTTKANKSRQDIRAENETEPGFVQKI